MRCNASYQCQYMDFIHCNTELKNPNQLILGTSNDWKSTKPDYVCKKMAQPTTLTGFVVQVHTSQQIFQKTTITQILIQSIASHRNNPSTLSLPNNKYYSTPDLILSLALKPSSPIRHSTIDNEPESNPAFSICRQTLNLKINISHNL